MWTVVCFVSKKIDRNIFSVNAKTGMSKRTSNVVFEDACC